MTRFEALQLRYDALQPRERLLMALTVGVLAVAAVYVLVVEPARKSAEASRQQIESTAPQVEALRGTVARLEAELARDPEAERRAALARLQTEIADQDQRLRDDEGNVIPPARVPVLLRELLGRDSRLVVLGVRSLPPEVLRWQAPAVEGPAPAVPAAPVPAASTVVDSPAAAAAAIAAARPPHGASHNAPLLAATPVLPALYRHRVALRFEGDYAAALEYVRRVEDLPYRLRLHRLEIDAEAWPTLDITLEVETLGLEEGWIGV